MKVDFDMIFRLNAVQKLVAEHCVSDFYMIFHLKAAQHLVAEQYMNEISTWFSTSWGLRNWLQGIMKDFDLIFRLKADQNLVANLQNTVNEIFAWFFTLRRLNTWLQSTLKDFDTIFHFMVAQNGVAEHYGTGWVTGLTPMTMNKNRFNLVDLVLNNFTRKKARRL